MIVGGLMRFPPPPAPEARPVMWKNLGIVLQDHTGYVEAHYALKTFRGDYDVDTEIELRTAARELYIALVRSGQTVDPNVHFVLQSRLEPRVRLVMGEHDVPTVVGGRQ